MQTMSHRSRIAAFRHPGDSRRLQDLARFWGATSELPLPGDSAGALRASHCAQRGEWRFDACPLGAAGPAQLDIETDNLEAEAARLEERGARRIGHLRERMWLLEAPGGERLRVLAGGSAPSEACVHWG